MIKKLRLLAILVFIFPFAVKAQMINQQMGNVSMEQPQPFLFTINTLNPAARSWSLNYAGGYGQRTVTPLGYDGIDQNIGIKGYLGNKFTMLASMGIGFGTNGNIESIQQAEVIRDFIGGSEPTGFRMGAGLGFRREFNNDKVA
ncbi:MAG TPA: hypothetical protein VGM63_03180, partial [Mucilaginibacter sp.]